MAHAKNCLIRLSDPGIIVNVDADNYCGTGFDDWILKSVSARHFAFGTFQTMPGAGGRIAAWKHHLESIHGYDERMQGWGMEDLDLKKRLRASGLRFVHVPRKYINVIQHSDEVRLANYKPEYRARMGGQNKLITNTVWHNPNWGSIKGVP